MIGRRGFLVGMLGFLAAVCAWQGHARQVGSCPLRLVRKDRFTSITTATGRKVSFRLDQVDDRCVHMFHSPDGEPLHFSVCEKRENLLVWAGPSRTLIYDQDGGLEFSIGGGYPESRHE